MAKKEIKLFNGRFFPTCSGRKFNQSYHISIGAYSKADAARILGVALRSAQNQISEINIYFSKCWGYRMEKVVKPPERGAWYNIDYNEEPIHIVDQDGKLIPGVLYDN